MDKTLVDYLKIFLNFWNRNPIILFYLLGQILIWFVPNLEDSIMGMIFNFLYEKLNIPNFIMWIILISLLLCSFYLSYKLWKNRK